MEESIKHYGVIGMKWGVKKNASRAYSRASKKLSKLDKKVIKSGNKVDKSLRKYDKSRYGFSLDSEEETRAKGEKVKQTQYKHEKNLQKANKWYKTMEKTFSETSIKMTAEDTAKGANYLKELDALKQAKINKMYI